MHLPRYIKSIPTFVDGIPLLKDIGGLAVYPYIFLKHTFYLDLKKKSPTPKTLYILLHEQTHIQRAEEKGVLLWMLLYAVSPSFRVNEELAADAPAMKYWKKQGFEYNFDRRARFLAGPLYFWPISYGEAKQKLVETWEKV